MPDLPALQQMKLMQVCAYVRIFLHTYFERSIFVLSYLLFFVGIVVTTRDCLFVHLPGLEAPASGTGA